MAVLACTRSHPAALDGQGTLMAQCLAAGVPLASSCSGRGACGRCAVEVLEGASALSTPTHREQAVLQRNGIDSPWRLACSCRVTGTGGPVILRTGYW